jgi:4-hydroxybenzoate polyprenyltransferase
MAGPASPMPRADSPAAEPPAPPSRSRQIARAVGRVLRNDPLGIGAVAGGLLLGTSALLGLPVDGPLLVLGVCGTALVYWADRVWAPAPEDAINRPDRLRWRAAWAGWLRVEAVGLAVCAAAALPWLRLQTLGAAALLGGVGAAHVLPLLPGRRRLAAFGAAKPLAISAVWAVGAVALPVVEAGAAWTAGAAALVAYRLAFVLPNVLLADWGDRRGDAAAGRPTLVTGRSGRQVRVAASSLLAVALLGAAGAVAGGAPALLAVDAAGPALLLAGVWGFQPARRPGHAALADWIVAWPAVTWAVAAAIG